MQAMVSSCVFSVNVGRDTVQLTQYYLSHAVVIQIFRFTEKALNPFLTEARMGLVRTSDISRIAFGFFRCKKYGT